METGEESPESLIAIFQSLSSEGDILLQRGCYHEAISVYTKALELRPEAKHCLISRSRCYIQIGNPELGLKDANECLKDNPDFFKGIYLKAEALYAQGDFEMALLFYHRGHFLRPELSEFRIGIQKAREAIDNSIGDSKSHILVPENVKKQWVGHQNDKDKSSIALGSIDKTTMENLTPVMESKLLGELFEDKLYLSDLLKDKDFIDYPDEHVIHLANDGLRYLNSRADFWRQQNPLSSRKKSHIKPKTAPNIKIGQSCK